WSRHNRGLARALAVVAVLLLVVNIAGPILTFRLQSALKNAELARTELQRKAVEAQSAKELAENRANENARLSETNAELAQHNARLAELKEKQRLDEAENAATERRLRQEAEDARKLAQQKESEALVTLQQKGEVLDFALAFAEVLTESGRAEAILEDAIRTVR